MEIFVVIWIILFFYIIVKNIGQFIGYEKSPVLTVPATVIDMRRKPHHHNHNGHVHISHSYHITFEVKNGERIALRVKRYEYNELSVGDSGILTYQGTRYKGFQR